MPSYVLLPRLTVVAALVAWGFTVLGLFGTSSFAEKVAVGAAALLVLIAQKPDLKQVSLLLWLSGGIWAGAAYQSNEVIGLAYFVVAVFAIFGAAINERRQGGFSITGPVAFLAAMLIVLFAVSRIAV